MIIVLDSSSPATVLRRYAGTMAFYWYYTAKDGVSSWFSKGAWGNAQFPAIGQEIVRFPYVSLLRTVVKLFHFCIVRYTFGVHSRLSDFDFSLSTYIFWYHAMFWGFSVLILRYFTIYAFFFTLLTFSITSFFPIVYLIFFTRTLVDSSDYCKYCNILWLGLPV